MRLTDNTGLCRDIWTVRPTGKHNENHVRIDLAAMWGTILVGIHVV